jgi:hypothetical protein
MLLHRRKILGNLVPPKLHTNLSQEGNTGCHALTPSFLWMYNKATLRWNGWRFLSQVYYRAIYPPSIFQFNKYMFPENVKPALKISWADLGANSALRNEKPATNPLKYGTAKRRYSSLRSIHTCQWCISNMSFPYQCRPCGVRHRINVRC